MSVNGGTVTDTVANWGGPAACGDSGAVINVTVPSSTPSGDTVYLSGNYDVLGTGIPASDNWVAADYPMTQTGPDTWSLTLTGVPVAAFQYKFTLGSWNNVEETGSCGFSPNHTFGFSTAGTYTANDTVAAWKESAAAEPRRGPSRPVDGPPTSPRRDGWAAPQPMQPATDADGEQLFTKLYWTWVLVRLTVPPSL